MFQKITLIGRLGDDPQLRRTPDGIAVCNFSIATTETVSKTKADGSERPCPKGWKESYNGKNWELTTWWRATAWHKMAENVAQYQEKGSQVFVECVLNGEAVDGYQNPRVWTGKDGIARASNEVTVHTIKFLGGKGGNGNGGATTSLQPPPNLPDEDDSFF